MRIRIAALVFVALVMGQAVLADDRAIPPVPPSGSVAIPLDEYNQLLELAAKTRKTDLPPAAYSVKRAEFVLTAGTGSVRGKVQVEGEVFNKGMTKIPVATGWTVFDAQRDGKPLALMQENGTHVAVLTGSSAFSLALDAGLPLVIDAGRASFRLPVLVAGTATLKLIVPGEHANVRIHPGIITNRTTENGMTKIDAVLQPGQAAEVSWTTREVETPSVPREVRFVSDLKTLLTVSEGELRVASLAEITVLQGDPSQFSIALPPSYELDGITGGSIDSTEENAGVLTVKVLNPTVRSHQFLLTLEKSTAETKVDAPFLTFQGAQRETGEILVEGTGMLELTATEGGGLKRIDLKETNSYLRSMARNSVQAAFRYHRQTGETPALALEWTRFPDSRVLAAVVDRAVVTTLVTTEGKSLTEVKLEVKNQAQPFLKLALPPGASILSAEVEGERVKPVEGSDGTRVPLLRAGFRPVDTYTVDFVYLHSGAPFSKQGGAELTLPRMDVPIDILQWEVFLPDRYKVKEFGGDAIAANQFVPGTVTFEGGEESVNAGEAAYPRSKSRDWNILAGKKKVAAPPPPPPPPPTPPAQPISLNPGELGGYIYDSSGAYVPGTKVTVVSLDTGAQQETETDQSGGWTVQNLPSGRIQIKADKPGFKLYRQTLSYDANRPVPMNLTLSLGSVTETVEVMSATSDMDLERDAKRQAEQQQQTASSNVVNFQQRVAGVLPIHVDVPRAGSSYRFFRPLVLDEETKVTFAYKTK